MGGRGERDKYRQREIVEGERQREDKERVGGEREGGGGEGKGREKQRQT